MQTKQRASGTSWPQLQQLVRGGGPAHKRKLCKQIALPTFQGARTSSSTSKGARNVACNNFSVNNLSSLAGIQDEQYAEGAFRTVHLGTYKNGPREGEKCVAKWFKDGPVYDNKFFSKDLNAVDKAQEIINKFNDEGIISQRVYLNRPAVWVFAPESDWAGQKHLVEPFIPNYQKFNSNTGVQMGDDGWPAAMQALSHFSYHTTGGRYVLCDLQGGVMDGGKSVILTDPVILSRDREFGVTDLGSEGISTFFARHNCTKFCREHWHQPRKQLIYFGANVGTTMMM